MDAYHTRGKEELIPALDAAILVLRNLRDPKTAEEKAEGESV